MRCGVVKRDIIERPMFHKLFESDIINYLRTRYKRMVKQQKAYQKA